MATRSKNLKTLAAQATTNNQSNKEDEAHFFIEFVIPVYTHFRIWKMLATQTKAHLDALMNLTSTPVTEVAVVAEGDAFNTTTSCGHCGAPGDEVLCHLCESGFEAFRGDYGPLTKGEKSSLTRKLNQRRKANGWQQ